MRQAAISALSWRRALLICLVCSLPACITLSTQKISTDDLASDPGTQRLSLQQEVDRLARPIMAEAVTPGLMVGVYTPTTGYQFFGYGVYDQQINNPPTRDTVFPAGSLTKLFVGALVSLAVQRGELQWDDTLAELLPADTTLSPDAAAITLEQLVTHTSGLPRQPMTVQTFGYVLRYLFTGRSFYDHYDEAYMLRFLRDFKKPTFPGYLYSNVGYAVLGHILELRSGMPIDTLLVQQLFEPLQLNHTTLAPERLSPSLPVARGYAGDQPGFIKRGEPTPDWNFTALMRTTGAMHSTADDLLRFATAHFKSRQEPLASALANALTVRYRDDDVAVGIDWEENMIQGQRIYFAVGFVAGYSSYVGLDAEHQIAVVVLQNSFNWEDRVGHQLLMRLKSPTMKKLSSS